MTTPLTPKSPPGAAPVTADASVLPLPIWHGTSSRSAPPMGAPRAVAQRPYTGPRIGCSYCIWEMPGCSGQPKDGPPATVLCGEGRAARALCARHAESGTWRGGTASITVGADVFEARAAEWLDEMTDVRRHDGVTYETLGALLAHVGREAYARGLADGVRAVSP